MDGYMVHGPIAMPRGGLARIDDGRGILIEVWDGGLWITQEGDCRDYFAGPGEAFALERDGALLAYALRASRVTLSAPVASHYARRITLAFPGAARPRLVYDRSLERGGFLAGLGQRLARHWVNSYARRFHPTTAAL
jgi:hypothetical protein